MRKIFFLLLLTGFTAFSLSAQTGSVSDAFTISGEVEKPLTVTLDSVLHRQNLVSVDSLVIYSHDMRPRHTIHAMKGVLLKDILSNVKMNSAGPKDLSTFYFVCTATDGYKVVFSWNELFNNETGNHVMIIVSEEGKSVKQLEDRIALISPTDKATGRRYVKWLKEITVARVK